MNDYDTDTVGWSERQAALLRRRAAGELINEADLDWPNIAEEIESLGKREQQRLYNRVMTVLEHLIRLQASPSIDPRAGWRSTIVRSRVQIAKLLQDNPSLRPTAPDVIAGALPAAREIAAEALAEHGEQPRVELDTLTYSVGQVLGPWWPQ